MVEPVRHLIIARWVEDIGWSDDVHGWERLVIQKNMGEGGDMPNVGREASSYFLGLHRLYDRLKPDDIVACLQGWPFDHVPNVEILGHEIPRGFHFIGPKLKSDGLGYPNHGGIPVKDCYEKWVGGEFPREVEFSIGAQFIVSADLILARPKEEYERMVHEVYSIEIGPWVMERLWKSYFEVGYERSQCANP